MTAAARKRSTRTLTEIERQEAYLAALPDDFQFPLFSGKQAVESQRKSAYKTTAHAAREIIDNALEAGASNVWVVLKRPGRRRQKHERQDAVAAVAFIDDGPGMRPDMARFALSWGGGTHTKDPDFIARFGFGLPNSSINQTRRVEVYSKAADAEQWIRAVLDINDVPEFGLASIPEPEPAELPDFVEEFLERKDVDLKSGTIVVWDRPDRLTYAQGTRLMTHPYRMLPRSQLPFGQILCLNDAGCESTGRHRIACYGSSTVTTYRSWLSGRRTVKTVSDWWCMTCNIRFRTTTEARGTSLRDTPAAPCPPRPTQERQQQ